MNRAIYNPLEEYQTKFKALHSEKTEAFFNDLVKSSGIDIEENRKTVKALSEVEKCLEKLKKKLTVFKVLRVLMIITLILIFLVIWKITPKIKKLREEIAEFDKKIAELLFLARAQMAPLNNLFADRNALELIESTIPLISFSPTFSAKQEEDMKLNYDFPDNENCNESTLDVLSGSYNGNPFLYENKLVHTLGLEVYHGYRTIHWTESYYDSNGKRRTRSRSQTLHATVTKPKPFYSTQVVLNYCAQGAPDLEFSRDATHLEKKSEREIDRYVKKGEKRIRKKSDKATHQNGNFTAMSNTDFEVLFDALDRSDEVQFRTLFTPLAQTNMVDLILSADTYGDDFDFIKKKRTNKIITNHSRNREICLRANSYVSHSFDVIKENFISKNEEFFKAVYFDFAPLLAIPVYQERPVHSLKPIPKLSHLYSDKDCEVLANLLDPSLITHPRTKTKSILKSTFVSSSDSVDTTTVTAYSYDIEPRVDVVSVWGQDGRFHNVSVPWDEYIPLVSSTEFYVTHESFAKDKPVITKRHGLCIYN